MAEKTRRSETLGRIGRRARLEVANIPTRLLDRMFAIFPERYLYRKGLATMGGSIENLKRNDFRPGLIIDVGAYCGNWSRAARRIYPDVPIQMVEANPQKGPVLSKTVQELGQAGYRIALLGAHPADAVEFHLMETGSSVLWENTSMPRSTVQLPMQTLDSVITDGRAPYLLKLDVQGFELQVLQGAELILRNVEVVILEVSLMQYNEGAPQVAEVVAWMRSRGFVMYDISGLLRRESDAALFMADLFFVREGSPLRSRRFFWEAEAFYPEGSTISQT